MGKKFAIKYVPHKELERFVDKDEEIYGYFDEVPGIIYIDNSLDKAVQDRILIHELVHATLSVSGISNLLKSNMEEAICDVMENWIDII